MMEKTARASMLPISYCNIAPCSRIERVSECARREIGTRERKGGVVRNRCDRMREVAIGRRRL